jgi:hypothetical protein
MTLKWKRTIRIGRSTENIQQSTFFGIQNDFCVFTCLDMPCYEVEVENGKAGEMSKESVAQVVLGKITNHQTGKAEVFGAVRV